MTDYAALLSERFPVRKTKAQRQVFRDWLTTELKTLGYNPREETNGFLKARNILVGNPDKTGALFTVRTDTPARWILPDLWFPRNLVMWLFWQLLHLILLLLPALMVYLAVWQISGQNARVGLWAFVLTYVATLLATQFGPANRVNRGEDADLAAMLTLMAMIPEEDRGKASFLFTGWMGARAWAKEHPLPAYTRLTVVFSRIGTGKTMLLVSNKSAEKATGFGSLKSTWIQRGERETEHYAAMGCTLRGDRKAFRCGVSLTACHRSKLLGLWCRGGHTSSSPDRQIDPENIAYVSECCAAFLNGLKLNRETRR